MPKLIIMKPEGEHDTFELSEDQACIVGRLPECSIQLDEKLCSRRHCQITKLSQVWEIVDLKSRNGTNVNGVQRTRHVLQDGDIIEIGSVRITFRERAGDEEEVVLEDMGGESGGAVGETCFLAFQGGPHSGEKIVLAGDRTTLGRKETNTVVMRDNMVSSYHCEITREGGGHVLRDLGSTNGSVVNGEPVSETALNHGARIRLGRSKFVFVDPAVADFEEALAAEEEAESEWGLMRAQVDMAAVRRKARASMIWLIGFVLVLGGAAGFFALNPDLSKKLLGLEEVAGIASVKGNLIPDFSFEKGEVAWTIAEGAPGDARVTAGPAKQGESALEVSGPREGTEAAIARSGVTQSVAAGRPYEISAWVKGTGARAAAGVQWNVAGVPAGALYSPTPWARSGEWNQVKAVVTPPSNATSCRIVLMVVGNGSARFDDVVLRESGGSPRATARLDSGGYTVSIGDSGAIAVERTGTLLLWNGGLLGVAEGGGAVCPDLCFRALRIDKGPAETSVVGSLLTPDGTTVSATITFKPEKDRLKIRYELEEAATGLAALGLGFVVSRDYLSEGATLTGAEGAREIHGETDAGGVKKLILGGTGNRLSLVAAEPFRLRVLSAGGLRLAMLSGPGDLAREYELVTDFTQQKVDARRLLGEARQAASIGELGKAMGHYDQVVNEYPFDDRTRVLAEKELAEILSKGRGRLDEVAKAFEAAKDFYDESDLQAAHAGVQKLIDEFEGHELAKEADALAQQVKESLDTYRLKRHDAVANRLLQQADDFRARKQTNLATEFYTEIRRSYPDTEAAALARKALEELKGN